MVLALVPPPRALQALFADHNDPPHALFSSGRDGGIMRRDMADTSCLEEICAKDDGTFVQTSAKSVTIVCFVAICFSDVIRSSDTLRPVCSTLHSHIVQHCTVHRTGLRYRPLCGTL